MLIVLLTGIAQSVFEAFAGPAGVALKTMFSITKGSNNLLMAYGMVHSMDNTYASFYSDIKEDQNNSNGVKINTNGNVDDEAVLQVFKVVTDDTVEIILNSDDPLEKYETYNISFVKNDQNVQPNGKVKVYLPIPVGMKKNTCIVYRQEKDKSWTRLEGHVEGNYLVFETDHFSLYTIVGQCNKLTISHLPDKTEYSLNEKLDTQGLTLSLADEEITYGYICTPAVLANSGKQTITVSYAGQTATFDIDVKATSVAEQNGCIVTVPGVTGKEIISATDSNAKIYKDNKEVRLDDSTKISTGMKIVTLSDGKITSSKDIAVLGDIDADGAISVSDARLALRAAVELDTLTGAFLTAANVDFKDDISVSDARLILRAAVKLDDPKSWLK